jgi:hypothetical protein
MKIFEAKVEGNKKEDPASEPDEARNTWLIVGKVAEEVPNWDAAQLDFRSATRQIRINYAITGREGANYLPTRNESQRKQYAMGKTSHSIEVAHQFSLFITNGFNLRNFHILWKP